MKSVRIYKDDIRTHILRSLFFTDTVLVLCGALVIAVSLYLFFIYVLHFFNWGYFVSTLIIFVMAFVVFITQRIDNQAIYKIVPRALTFRASKKQKRFNNLESYFVNFTIQDNFVLRQNNLISIHEIEPFDVALLNDQDREHFFIKLKQAIHVFSQVQFITKKARAKSDDYSSHFFSLYEDSSKKTEELINKYTEDLTNLINDHEFMTTKHYAVLSVTCNTLKPNTLVQGVKKLTDLSLRFASALNVSNVQVRQLESNELKMFVQETLR